MLDKQMHELLVEAILVVLDSLESHVDPEEWFAEPEIENLRSPLAIRSLGWIEGVADAHEATVLTLFDEERIRLEREELLGKKKRRALPRGR